MYSEMRQFTFLFSKLSVKGGDVQTESSSLKLHFIWGDVYLVTTAYTQLTKWQHTGDSDAC